MDQISAAGGKGVDESGVREGQKKGYGLTVLVGARKREEVGGAQAYFAHEPNTFLFVFRFVFVLSVGTASTRLPAESYFRADMVHTVSSTVVEALFRSKRDGMDLYSYKRRITAPST